MKKVKLLYLAAGRNDASPPAGPASPSTPHCPGPRDSSTLQSFAQQLVYSAICALCLVLARPDSSPCTAPTHVHVHIPDHTLVRSTYPQNPDRACCIWMLGTESFARHTQTPRKTAPTLLFMQ